MRLTGVSPLMTKRMLIDSTHAEETRVVVLEGNRLEEYDIETSTKHQLKGNIYLAKVVRVEPSLQAAFVEYGGNRHGFLAFGEIHPDYYQIPVADRKRLIEAQEEEAREEEERADHEAQTGRQEPRDPGYDDLDDHDDSEAVPVAADPDHLPAVASDEPTSLPDPDRVDHQDPVADAIVVEPDQAAALFADAPFNDALFNDTGADMAPEAAGSAIAFDIPRDRIEADLDDLAEPPYQGPAQNGQDNGQDEAPAPEQLGGEHDIEDHPARRATPRFLRNYKIQEVIRRRQILLVQVVKEERGSKGAALTTYISLAGRFSVLMPNSPRGGGISRKITSAADRRRLKEVTSELDLPRGMGLIVRTAGANRPKPEILRDCEYLLNQWDQIRDLTMKSMAPALIYEEASLIKRAIRDVYSRDVDDILVDGEQGWRAAREFMRMLMPTHARKVQLWKDQEPLFGKAQVESQLEAILAPTVQLKSGGYLVINQTEALVAIDVNSGRSTRERGIEETALRTNIEAAEEAARQLRLRDLAGLIVIDFIDMENRRNVAAVERRLKEALKNDRARIQVGPISHFGLLEMSRQRLRPSLTETNYVICQQCGGTGHVRATESAALHVLRAIEEEGGKRKAAEIVIHTHSSVALYILNHKRQRLSEIEARHFMLVAFVADDSLLPPAYRIERLRAQTATDMPAPVQQLAPPEPFVDPDELEAEPEDEAEDEVDLVAEKAAEKAADKQAEAAGETEEEREQRRGRRRRRRRGRRDDSPTATPDAEPAAAPTPTSTPTATGDTVSIADAASAETDAEPATAGEADAASAAEADAASAAAPSPADTEERSRRRSRRGGRRRRRDFVDGEAPPAGAAPPAEAEADADAAEEEDEFLAPPPPSYVGPTPADPFAGASAFDIFDAIEQAEEQRALAPKLAPTPQPAPIPQPAPQPAPQPEPAVTAAQVIEPEPKPEPKREPEPEPESETPQSAPLIQPIVIGGESAPAERKRGWWRR